VRIETGGDRITGQRGRPRSEESRRAIVDAAGQLMLEGGLAAATMEAIAARAGVSKATIYKWWPSRGAVALDGFLARVQYTLAIPEGAGTAEALEFQVDELIKLFRDTGAGPIMRAVVSQLESDPALAQAFRERWMAPRRAVAVDVIRTGIERGDLSPDIDIDAAMDQLWAPLYYRLIFGHGPLGPDLARTLVAQLLGGIGHRASYPLSLSNK
jgi:AcrR family transcriptional regulator